MSGPGFDVLPVNNSDFPLYSSGGQSDYLHRPCTRVTMVASICTTLPDSAAVRCCCIINKVMRTQFPLILDFINEPPSEVSRSQHLHI